MSPSWDDEQQICPYGEGFCIAWYNNTYTYMYIHIYIHMLIKENEPYMIYEWKLVKWTTWPFNLLRSEEFKKIWQLIWDFLIFAMVRYELSLLHPGKGLNNIMPHHGAEPRLMSWKSFKFGPPHISVTFHKIIKDLSQFENSIIELVSSIHSSVVNGAEWELGLYKSKYFGHILCPVDDHKMM